MVKISDTDNIYFVLQFFIVLLIILLAELILLILFFVYTDKVRLCKSTFIYSNDRLPLWASVPTYPMIHLCTSVCPGERKRQTGPERRAGAVQHG